MFRELVDTSIHFSGDAYRNVSTILVSENLLDDLTDNPADGAFGEELVSRMKKTEDLSPIISRPFIYGMSIGKHRYPTRFSDGTTFGVWYGSLDMITTIYETLYHWQALLLEADITLTSEVIADRRVFLVSADGLLIDLRAKTEEYPKLVDPDDSSYCRKLSAYLYSQSVNGILVHSARHTEGVNIAVFRQRILSNPRHNCYLRYRWKPGDPRVRVERKPGRTWKSIPSFF